MGFHGFLTVPETSINKKGSIVNDAVIDMEVQTPLQDPVFTSFGVYLAVGLLGRMVILFFEGNVDGPRGHYTK